MNKLILDCDLMRHPNSGLYHYCLNLGHYINKILEEQGAEKIGFYVPPAEVNSFSDPKNTIVEKRWHKSIKPFLWRCKLWHAPFQSGRVVPYENKSIKVLLTIHDLNALHEGKPPDEQKKSLEHTQKLIDRATAIVCISEFTKKDVLKNCKIGNKPVYVIHNGTHKIGEPKLSPSSYRPARPFLFGMGYVNAKKNYHVLTSLLKSNEDIELIIAGRLDEADYISTFMKDAEELNVADRLHLLGPVTEEEKGWYLSSCLAFVHPSLAEGFGAPVVEAMQFGKPLFLSNKTSLPEIGGDVAFYFSSFDPDHMQQVYQDGMKCYTQSDFSEKIKERAKAFNWEKNAFKYLDVYNTLLNA
ncbi:MAG: glycosyltransferase family 4 protein [Flavisolibacter sp.]|nr:glycosyltransferase family 4 protein [Flavisolibacter sp.]